MLATVCILFISFIKGIFINEINLECQIPTQRYGRRPFGVGFLMAGYDVS